jgi:hypothetical protein
MVTSFLQLKNRIHVKNGMNFFAQSRHVAQKDNSTLLLSQKLPDSSFRWNDEQFLDLLHAGLNVRFPF